MQQRSRLVRGVAEFVLQVGGGLLGEPRVPRDGRVRLAAAAPADLALVRFQRERAKVLEKRRPSPGNNRGPDERASAPVVLLALPAPLPVFFITGPQLERDAPVLIVYSFCVHITLHSDIDHGRVPPAPPEQGVSTDIARERR